MAGASRTNSIKAGCRNESDCLTGQLAGQCTFSEPRVVLVVKPMAIRAKLLLRDSDVVGVGGNSAQSDAWPCCLFCLFIYGVYLFGLSTISFIVAIRVLSLSLHRPPCHRASQNRLNYGIILLLLEQSRTIEGILLMERPIAIQRRPFQKGGQGQASEQAALHVRLHSPLPPYLSESYDIHVHLTGSTIERQTSAPQAPGRLINRIQSQSRPLCLP